MVVAMVVAEAVAVCAVVLVILFEVVAVMELCR